MDETAKGAHASQKAANVYELQHITMNNPLLWLAIILDIRIIAYVVITGLLNLNCRVD